jgi:prevent-host-death family protein
MKKAALSEVKDDLSRFLRLAEKEEVVITRHGKAAGVLIGFESEEDWFDYRLENDTRFLDRIDAARASLRAGQGVTLGEVVKEGGPVPNSALQRPRVRATALAKKRSGRATRSRR